MAISFFFFFSDTRYLLDCVRVARGSCPNMALLGDEEFAAAVDNMGLVYNTYCAGGYLCLYVHVVYTSLNSFFVVSDDETFCLSFYLL